jgi:hypothetical protein
VTRYFAVFETTSNSIQQPAARAGIDEALFGIARGRLKPRVMFRAAGIAAESAPNSHVAVVHAGRKRPGTPPLLEGRQYPHRQLELPVSDPLKLKSVVAPSTQQMNASMLRIFSTRDEELLAQEIERACGNDPKSKASCRSFAVLRLDWRCAVWGDKTR